MKNSMAIFGSKKKKTEKTASDAAPEVAPKKSAPVIGEFRSVIRRPRLTEKAANLTVGNVYTFEIEPGASKHDVARAVKALYKVTPKKIAVVNTKGKRVSLRTRRGMGRKSASRKAYVYLKAGDKIDFAA